MASKKRKKSANKPAPSNTDLEKTMSNENEENTLPEGNEAGTPTPVDAEFLNEMEPATDTPSETEDSSEPEPEITDPEPEAEPEVEEVEEIGAICITIEEDPRTAGLVSDALNILVGTPGYSTATTAILDSQQALYNALIRTLVRLPETASRSFLNQLLDIISAHKQTAFSAKKAFRGFESLGSKAFSVQQIDEFQMLLRVLIDTSAKENRHSTASKLNWDAIQNAFTDRNANAIASRLRSFYNI